ncbi:MAG: class I SAM-dependent methyltransferase [Alphaproteobacteria bacterium]
MTGTGKDGRRRRDWAGYYAGTRARPPRHTLLAALDRFDREGGPAVEPRIAVDLGAGGGRDAVELLRRGWRVLALDAAPEAAAMLVARPDLPAGGALVARTARFETALWPRAHLVNASFSLPLCPPAAFPALWRRIADSLLPGGRFTGQFYGERDDFAADPALTCHTAAEMAALLDGWKIEMLEEVEEDSVTPRGRPKHWHIRHVVARRDGGPVTRPVARPVARPVPLARRDPEHRR